MSITSILHGPRRSLLRHRRVRRYPCDTACRSQDERVVDRYLRDSEPQLPRRPASAVRLLDQASGDL
jgi:hypothetical protein